MPTETPIWIGCKLVAELTPGSVGLIDTDVLTTLPGPWLLEAPQETSNDRSAWGLSTHQAIQIGSRFSKALDQSALWCGLLTDPESVTAIVGSELLFPYSRVRLIGVAISAAGAQAVSEAEASYHPKRGVFTTRISRGLHPPSGATALGWDVVTFLPGVGFDEGWRTISGAAHVRASHSASLNHNALISDLESAEAIARAVAESGSEPGIAVPLHLYELEIPETIGIGKWGDALPTA
jgi:hypothetical protein